MKFTASLFLFSCLSIFAIENNIESNTELFEGKNILITGGTGYLGRTLTSEILKYNPNSIKILSRDEVKLFNSQKLFNYNPKIKNVLGDIRDYNCLLTHTTGIDLVIHTAALKRIDALEDNVEESIKTNIIGTLNLFNTCTKNHVKKVLFISTDKACLPINTYGACKFISEKIFTNYDHREHDTVFTVVRYGNILESTGSVIPIFSEKIKKGEEITLTDERMTRFIISKDEAVTLIFDALRYSVGGEIFVPKNLPSITIVDLIDVLKEKYNADNKTTIIGLRPGEKIHEILINESELKRTYDFKNMYIITPSINNWLDYSTKKQFPLYISKGTLLQENSIKQYSSDNSLITQKDIVSLFKKLAIY